MPLGTVANIPRTYHKGEDVTFPYSVEASYAPAGIAGFTLLETIVVGATTVTMNGAITSAGAGEFETVLTAAVSETIPAAAGNHDMWRMNAGFHHILGKGAWTAIASPRVP